MDKSYHLKDYGNSMVNGFRDSLWQRGNEENTIDSYCIAVRLFCDYSKIKKLTEGIFVDNYIFL